MHGMPASGELSTTELTAVIGGTKITATPPPQPKPTPSFEVSDYSFDIEQVLNNGS